jgi:hypothetical protein
VSFAIFVESFGTSPREDTSAVRKYLEPLLDGPGHIVVVGGESEIYGLEHDPLTGLMFTHTSGKAMSEVIYRTAILGGWVVYPVGCPVCITSEAQAGSLAPELVAEYGYRLVRSGGDIWDVIATA